ncbi:hypothetical protein [Streptomyces sp. NPDC002403]
MLMTRRDPLSGHLPADCRSLAGCIGMAEKHIANYVIVYWPFISRIIGLNTRCSRINSPEKSQA